MTTTQYPRLAFDIETVSPTVPADEYPDFDDPTDFELLAVGLGVQESPDADIQTEVLFRDGWGHRSELELISDVFDWLRERSVEGSDILTYNGADFDFPIMLGRATIAATQLTDAPTDLRSTGDRLSAWLRGVNHVDLKPPVWDRLGEYTKLEEACFQFGVDVTETEIAAFDHGLNPEDWRTSVDGPPHVESSDVAIIGESYLEWADEGRSDSRFRELQDMIDHYARADIAPLYELDAALAE